MFNYVYFITGVWGILTSDLGRGSCERDTLVYKKGRFVTYLEQSNISSNKNVVYPNFQ